MAASQKMKANTAASPVMDSHPQECFTADLSVFQAHLPRHDRYDIIMIKPLVYINRRAGNRTINHLQRIIIKRFTRFDFHKLRLSLRLLTHRRLQSGTGDRVMAQALTPALDSIGFHRMVFYYDLKSRSLDAAVEIRCNGGGNRENKNPAGSEAGGVLEKFR